MEIGLSFWDYAIITAYFISLGSMGLWFARKKQDTAAGYLLGGRKMPWFAVGISIMMSLLSTFSLVMVPGEIFNHGLTLWAFNLAAPLITIGCFFIFPRFYFKLKSFTPFEYLEIRYDRKVRTLIAFLYTYSKCIYLAMVLFTSAIVFEGSAGWPAYFTIPLIGIVCIAYTIQGGLKAIVWIEFFQFFILVGGFMIAIGVIVSYVGFFDAIKYAFDHGRGFDNFSQDGFYTMNPYVRLTMWMMIINIISTALSGSASDQITIQRLLSTSDFKSALKAQLTASFVSIPFTLILWFIGLGIFAYYSQNPDPRVLSGDGALFTFIATRVPAPVPGLILAAMLAAVMSTVGSGINSFSTIWLKEFHEKYINKKMSERKEVSVSRVATVIFCVSIVITALLIDLSSKLLGQSVVEAMTIFSIFDVIVLPAFLFAVISKRAGSRLIWGMALYLWSMKIGIILWYMLSKYATKNWVAGMSAGYAGPLSMTWVVIPVLLFVILLGIWFCRRFIFNDKSLIFYYASLFPAGFASATLTWYIFSNVCYKGEPLELSFQWVGLPVTVAYLVFGIVGLCFAKVPPSEKYMGLTLGTMNAEVKE